MTGVSLLLLVACSMLAMCEIEGFLDTISDGRTGKKNAFFVFLKRCSAAHTYLKPESMLLK
jgi:hypothetical protein